MRRVRSITDGEQRTGTVLGAEGGAALRAQTDPPGWGRNTTGDGEALVGVKRTIKMRLKRRGARPTSQTTTPTPSSPGMRRHILSLWLKIGIKRSISATSWTLITIFSSKGSVRLPTPSWTCWTTSAGFSNDLIPFQPLTEITALNFAGVSSSCPPQRASLRGGGKALHYDCSQEPPPQLHPIPNTFHTVTDTPLSPIPSPVPTHEQTPPPSSTHRHILQFTSTHTPKTHALFHSITNQTSLRIVYYIISLKHYRSIHTHGWPFSCPFVSFFLV